jgi:hypothetical protein
MNAGEFPPALQDAVYASGKNELCLMARHGAAATRVIE